MSDPIRQVPLSPVSLGHEVFGYVWGVVFLATLRVARPGDLPFRCVLVRFLEERRDQIDRLIAHIRDGLALPPEAMGIFDEVRSGWTSNEVSDEELTGWLLLYTRNRESKPADLSDVEIVARLFRYGVSCQLYGLAGALTLGLAARAAESAEAAAAVAEALTEAASIAGEREPGAVARWSYKAWCVAELGNHLSPSSHRTEESKADLRKVVDGLDAVM